MSVFAKVKASRSRSLKSVLGGVAMVAVGAMVLVGCSPTDDAAPEKPGSGEELVLKIGGITPLSGQLAFLGPPQVAGYELAAKEINAADMGIKIELTIEDEGDPENKAYATTVSNQINRGVDAIVGAAASGVSLLIIDQIIGAGIVMVSPSNTTPALTEYEDDGLYFRTAPSDLLQGEVLGNVIADDGHSTLGILALNDAYGTGLDAAITETFEGAGGEVVASEYFNAGDTTYDAQINKILAQKPDALALVTFDQSLTVIPALAAAGFDLSKLYLVDGNTLQYGDDSSLPDLSLEGAKGTFAGAIMADDFWADLQEVFSETNNGEVLKDTIYAGEAYDAVMVLALAALAASSTEGKDIAAKMQEVSGGSGDGETATDFKSAAQIIIDGGVVDYEGHSGGVAFNEFGDPTEASIGVYQYDASNNHTRIN